ncbi:hypothetical protein C8F01DRAFT_499925 [Mycena amicta]|nr:hypothetical protein C8F01DRAFT_499925 [Mycena amicta]
MSSQKSSFSPPTSSYTPFSASSSITTTPTRPSPSSSCNCNIVTNSISSATKSGSLSTGTAAADTGFAHNIGGIIGVSLGGLVAVIGGVFIAFFACGWYRRRRAQAAPSPPMRQSGAGGWRSPLGGDGDSVGDAETSFEHASDSLGHTSTGHAHMAFSRAGATLATGMEPGFWYAGADVSSPSSQGHSSQSHSQSHTGGLSSTGSHGPLLAATTSSDVMHSKPSSGNASSSSPEALPSPPSSYSESRGNKLMGRLRGRQGPPPPVDVPPLSTAQKIPPLPPSPRFVPPAPYDPSIVQVPPAPSSLLNPPVPVIDFTPAATVPPNWPYSRPTPSRVFTDESETMTPATEGLLRPGLLLPTHSTRTLGDHVDYSRPLASQRPGLGGRMDTSNTYASTNVSMDGHEDDDVDDGIPRAT